MRLTGSNSEPVFLFELKGFLEYILNMNLGEKQIVAEDWNHSVIRQNGSFLQSWQWGEFQKSLGREVFFFKEDDWQALVIKYNLPLGKNYLYLPRVILSPSIRLGINSANDLSGIEELARKENSIFLRIEPGCHSCENGNPDLGSRFWIPAQGRNDKKCGENERGLKESGFIKTKDIQPSKTLILDLVKSEEGLFRQMHEKTRYNIGLAERKGVKIKKTEYNEEDFDKFWEIINLTAGRQGIRMFPKEYYKKQLQSGNSDLNYSLFIAEFEGKPIAANIVNIFGKTATYLHGGSNNEFRSLMAPHLLQWEQIKEAKNQGCQFYDFWGYDEQKWPGVSRFKRGFGGREVNYPGCFDLPINKKWYFIYKRVREMEKLFFHFRASAVNTKYL